MLLLSQRSRARSEPIGSDPKGIRSGSISCSGRASDRGANARTRIGTAVRIAPARCDRLLCLLWRRISLPFRLKRKLSLFLIEKLCSGDARTTQSDKEAKQCARANNAKSIRYCVSESLARSLAIAFRSSHERNNKSARNLISIRSDLPPQWQLARISCCCCCLRMQREAQRKRTERKLKLRRQAAFEIAL